MKRSHLYDLGNPNGAAALIRANKGNADSLNMIKQKADHHAQRLAPVVQSIKDDGYSSLAAIAKELNARAMKTPRGGQWHPTSVKNLMARLEV